MPIASRLLFSVSLLALTACEFWYQQSNRVAPGIDSPRIGNDGAAGSGAISGSSDVSGRGLNYLLDGRKSVVRRLSRTELVASLAQLTGEVVAQEDFPLEQQVLHQVTKLSGQSFGATEIPRLRGAVADFAAAKSASMLTKSQCRLMNTAQADCLWSWAKTLASNAFRRPLVAVEAERLKAIASEANGTAEADMLAVEAVLTSVFLAPTFLYRTEVGGEGRLTDREIATKLSYTSTGLPPDALLSSAAESGALRQPDTRRAHYQRLAKTAAGLNTHSLFVLDWLGALDVNFNNKSTATTAGLAANYASALRSSAVASISTVLQSTQPTVRSLLETTTFANDAVVKAVTETSIREGIRFGETPATQRKGLLMHPYVLAAHAKDGSASAFSVGSFVRESLLCEPKLSVPANAASLVRADPPPGLSQRQTLEYKTSAAPHCTGCHAQFADLGFAFAAFDGLGRWRIDEPNGKMWDFSGQSPLTWGAQTLTFDTASDLSSRLGALPQVQGCFAHRLANTVLGRNLTAGERTLSDSLDTVAEQSAGNIFSIIETIITSDEFISTTP
jgi:hypothetical protein